MQRLLLAWFLLPLVFGGSPCPARVRLYPCICIDRRIGKSKFDTTVICQGLSSGNSLAAIEPSLSGMEINTFLLYDSYWPKAPDARRNREEQLQAEARIPVNHVSKLKIDEVKIVDTTLSNFGCPTSDNCITSYVKKFTAVNTTAAATERCNNIGLTIETWVSCPGNIEELTINKGFSSEAYLKPEFFTEPMNKLRVLRLPNNNIQRIDRRTFINSKFPVLRTLDLSYNSLLDAKSIFTSPLEVEDLDLSHNAIKSIPDFQRLPKLKILKLNDNKIVSLLEDQWSNMPMTIITLDLTNNQIGCDCSMKWFNSSLPVHTLVLGSCVSPVETANKKLRRASRLLVERCSSDGIIMPTKQHHV